MFCSKCKCNHTEYQFIWEGIRHKTCKKYSRKDKEKLPARVADSTIEFVEQSEYVDHNTIQRTDADDVDRNEVDCLDIGDLVERELESLTANAVYHIRLLVNIDITPDMTAKEVAAIVVAEIESGDDYSWK